MPDNSLKQIPFSVLKGIDRWRYFGIDACPKSITRLAEMFFEIPSASLIHACVKGTHKLCKVDIFREPPYFVKNISITFDDLIKYLKIDRIDVLAMDIEGDEVSVLENYSFRIIPKFIAVESHEKYYLGNYGRLEAFLVDKGYKLLVSEMTNEGNTREYQFIHKGDVL